MGAIVPWNFPLNLASWKVAPALAAGVRSCSSRRAKRRSPLSSWRRSLPTPASRGRAQRDPRRSRTAGEALVRHAGVDKVAFTGSTEVGKRIAALAAETVKRVSLELGGKSANIVFADADLKLAARGAVGRDLLRQGGGMRGRKPAPRRAPPTTSVVPAVAEAPAS